MSDFNPCTRATRVVVRLRYDSNAYMGTIVRQDSSVTIIRLDDDRYFLASECFYTPIIRSANELQSADPKG